MSEVIEKTAVSEGPRSIKDRLAEDPALLEKLDAMSAEELLQWSVTEFPGRVGIITSFQNTGCAMIDMAGHIAPGMRVLTIDTLRLHDQTYALMDAIESKYGVEVERFSPDPKRMERMIEQHGEHLFFDSKEKQEFCCTVRKVEPHTRALRTVDVWITGLRRDHSDRRSTTPKASLVREEWGTILKLAPLADWSEEQVTDYVSRNDVPYNQLYDLGYTSIGCIICSTPTLPHEDKRAGRWRWFNATYGDDKECGIHTNIGGGGI